VTSSTVTKYYYAGEQRVAMRQGTTLYYLLSDHLGSTSLTTDASGNVVSEMRYSAWGEVRYNSGVTTTNYTFTGQRSYTDSFGLMYYGARWLDVSLGRFAQADSIVPGGVQGYDRYAYANNAPTKYVDPSGHDPWWCETNTCRAQAPSPGGQPRIYGLTLAAQYVNRSGSYYLNTYTAAGIGVQNPKQARTGVASIPFQVSNLLNGGNTGEGIAKVTDNQMNTQLGKITTNNGHTVTGLGMLGQDQYDGYIAAQAMAVRIHLRTGECENSGCKATDTFLAAALAENESINPKELRLALQSYPSTEGPVTMDWAQYLNHGDPNNLTANKNLIRDFANNMAALGRQGWYVPDVDWKYIYGLIRP